MALYQAGFNAKGRINGGAYAMASYRCRDVANDNDVSNSEGIPGNPAMDPAGGFFPFTESRISALEHMEAEVRNATFDTTRNPFAVPSGPNVASGGSAVNAGQYINLVIFVNGAGGVSWASPSFMVLDVSQDMDIHRLQPVSFSGKSDGFYKTPSS